MIFELHTGAIYLVPNKMFTEIGFASDAIGMISVVGLETSIINSRLATAFYEAYIIPFMLFLAVPAARGRIFEGLSTHVALMRGISSARY